MWPHPHICSPAGLYRGPGGPGGTAQWGLQGPFTLQTSLGLSSVLVLVLGLLWFSAGLGDLPPCAQCVLPSVTLHQDSTGLISVEALGWGDQMEALGGWGVYSS